MMIRSLIVIIALHGAGVAATKAQETGVQETSALQLKPTVFKPRPAPTVEADSSGSDPAYELKYKLAAGLTYPSQVTQLLSVQTTISGVKEDTVTNSVSGKAWSIESVDKEGNIQLFHQVDSVKMSQRTTGRQEVTYDSQVDSAIPSEYQTLEGTIGVPLTKVSMNPFGRISAREDLRPQTNPGIGDLTLSLPEQAIRVGDSWSVPDEVTVKVAGANHVVKIRYVYSLITVRAGLATITFRTELLSPIASDPRVMSQLVVRMQKGEIKFDIDEGRPISRTAQIEQAIVGFAGDNSSMRYDMRATEEFSEGIAIVASLPEKSVSPAGPSPTSNPSGKLLPGVSTGGKAEPMPTPATPPPAQGEPTPAEPRGRVTSVPSAPPAENSVLASQKS